MSSMSEILSASKRLLPLLALGLVLSITASQACEKHTRGHQNSTDTASEYSRSH